MVEYFDYIAILVAWVLKVNHEKLGKNNNNNALKKDIFYIIINILFY